MKHDNYYSYLLYTLLEPSYFGMILFSCIAKLVSCDFHNLLECFKSALLISTGTFGRLFSCSFAHLACSFSHSKVTKLSFDPSISFLLGFGLLDPNSDAHRGLSSSKQPSMIYTKKDQREKLTTTSNPTFARNSHLRSHSCLLFHE